MALWIKQPLAVLADGAEGGIVVADGRIIELVPAGATPETPGCAVFDASAHVVIPGLINTHHHFFQTLTRAHPRALNKGLFAWLKANLPAWQHLDAEMAGAAARLAMAELLLSGCTTAADHHYIFTAGLQDTVDLEVEAARELGMRVVLSRGAIDLDDDQGVTPPAMVEDVAHVLDHTASLLARYHDPAPGAMVQIAVAPSSPFQVTRELMQGSAELARRYGAPLHTHLAETRDEIDFCRDHYGCRTVQYLETLDWLADDVWVAHGVHFDAEELARLGEARVGVSHCPSSNAVLASGLCRVPELEAAGCPVGLGVDGSASNDHSNLMQELRQAFLTQRLAYGVETVTHLDALRWATTGSAACLGRDDIGRIAPGKRADLALFRLDEEPRFSGFGDPLAALVLCGAHRADRVMVEGRWVVEDAQLTGVDLKDIISRHTRAARAMHSFMA